MTRKCHISTEIAGKSGDYRGFSIIEYFFQPKAVELKVVQYIIWCRINNFPRTAKNQSIHYCVFTSLLMRSDCFRYAKHWTNTVKCSGTNSLTLII